MQNQDHQKQQFYVDNIEQLNGGSISRLDWVKLCELLTILIKDAPLAITPINNTAKFARGRILNSADKFKTIDTLSYPTIANCNNIGRCNRANAPVLYAGVGRDLILSEIGARLGDIIGLLHMSPTEEIHCLELGALNTWKRTDGHCSLDDNIKKEISKIFNVPKNIIFFIFDAFISDYFSRVGSQDTYKLTSAFTSSIFNSYPNIAGLIYDSVDHTAGSCLAFKTETFDKSLRPTEVQILKVTNFLGWGIYEVEELAFSNDFNGKEIIWD